MVGLSHTVHDTGESSCEVKTEADSSDHTEHSHGDNPTPYLSTVDDKPFTTKKYIHRKRLTGEKSYSCTNCEKRFSSKSGLSEHMNMHRDKYKCTECGKCCKSGSKLAVHRRSHSGEKPFECTVCSR